MITEGLIAIGILALIVAIFLLRGKPKTSQTSQQAAPKRTGNKQAVAATKPSVSPKTQVSFPATQVPFPVSAANNQAVASAEPSFLAKTQPPSLVPQVPFPASAADKQTAVLAEPSISSRETLTLTEASFPAQTDAVAQTPVQEAEQDWTQVPVALNGQLTTQLDQDLSETQTQSSIPSEVAPLSPLKPVSRSLRYSPSIDQQMAELIADTWALQQQAAEIGRRLNYLSNCIQYSLASEPHEPDANSKG